VPEDARLAPFAKFLLQTTKLHAESVPHTSLGLRLRRNPREAPTRNSTLKACHIADTKGGFHCKATENGQLSIADRLPAAALIADVAAGKARIHLYSSCFFFAIICQSANGLMIVWNHVEGQDIHEVCTYSNQAG
jgi:hypothetical protein